MREEGIGTRVQVADAGSQPRLGWRRKMTVELITGGQVGRRWSTAQGGAVAVEAAAWSWAHFADAQFASDAPTPPSGALVLGFISWRELG